MKCNFMRTPICNGHFVGNGEFSSMEFNYCCSNCPDEIPLPRVHSEMGFIYCLLIAMDVRAKEHQWEERISWLNELQLIPESGFRTRVSSNPHRKMFQLPNANNGHLEGNLNSP